MSIKNFVTSIGDAYKSAHEYIVARKEGKAPSLVTPFDQLNKLGVDGIPWQSHFVIGARSGVGKTLIKDQLLQGAFKLNPYDNIRVLDFSFEMPLQATGYRGIQSQMKQDKSMLLSTEGNEIDKNSLKRIEIIVKSASSIPWDIVDKQLTLKEIENTVLAYIEEYNKDNDLKLIISVDHSLLIKKTKSEQTHAVINGYGELITELRKKHNIIVFTLSQLNRNIEEGFRKIPGRADNYPQTSDISTADALLQHADFLGILNRPSDFNMKIYGPEKWLVPKNGNYVPWHILKNRSGEHAIIHLKANYQNYEFYEMTEEPESAEMQETKTISNPFRQQ